MSMNRRNGNGHLDGSLEALVDLYQLRCEVEGKLPNTVRAYAEPMGCYRAQRQSAQRSVAA